MYSYSFNVRKWIDKSLVYCFGMILLFSDSFYCFSFSPQLPENVIFILLHKELRVLFKYSLNVWKWIDKFMIYCFFDNFYMILLLFLQPPTSWKCRMTMPKPAPLWKPRMSAPIWSTSTKKIVKFLQKMPEIRISMTQIQNKWTCQDYQ